MIRLLLGVVSGIVAFFVCSAIMGVIVSSAWPDYAAVRESMDFTLLMQLMRLALGAVALIIAGAVSSWLVREQALKAALITGGVLLAIFVPIHIQLLEQFPLWYHAWFLLTIIPFCLLGSRVVKRNR